MKTVQLTSKNIFSLCCFILFLFRACKKENVPGKPQSSPFFLSSTLTSEVGKSASTYTLTIDGNTNGWWVTLPDNIQWYTIERKYGSGNITQKITLNDNDTGTDRQGWIKINSTSKEEITINFKQKAQ
ncbi:MULTISPECIES: hypothetical protein [Sphingobacterium]|uniref:hypothetical protein n=1 Tax=Sphingobacterium TaxID=28453 RepID=UPI000E826BA7|nr:hypothetical protein [Sphingobacterium multivorum]HAU55409.1 hypothetical protein [Sphingobacterium sp.]HCX56823.1 hypothetical protein [Sphingobacterium sp.]